MLVVLTSVGEMRISKSRIDERMELLVEADEEVEPGNTAQIPVADFPPPRGISRDPGEARGRDAVEAEGSIYGWWPRLRGCC